MSDKRTPEEIEKRKRESIAKLNETPTRIIAGYHQIKLLVIVTATLFGKDKEYMLRLKFKLEEIREAFLNCATQCSNLLKEIEADESAARSTATQDGNKDPEPPEAA